MSGEGLRPGGGGGTPKRALPPPLAGGEGRGREDIGADLDGGGGALCLQILKKTNFFKGYEI